MFCKNCGNELSANDKFCKSCGTKVEQTVKEEPKVEPKKEEVKQEATNANPVVENTNTTSNTQNVNNDTKKVEKLKGLRIASLVLGIISLVFFLLNVLLLPLEIVGIVLAIVYMVKNKKFCAGIVLNGIATILSLTLFFSGMAALTSFVDYANKNPDEFGKKIENIFDNIDKQLDDDLENSFDDASKKIQDAKDEIQKAKDEVKVYTDNNKSSTTSDKYKTGYKYVGSEEYGYIKVPNTWAKFVDVDPNDTIQYSYANTWIATIYATKNEELTTYRYAMNVYNKLKSDGAKSVNLVSQKVVDKYYGYKVSCYYENLNTYLTCWIFSDKDNVKHYVAIEGPQKDSEYFDLINTFSLENK